MLQFPLDLLEPVPVPLVTMSLVTLAPCLAHLPCLLEKLGKLCLVTISLVTMSLVTLSPCLAHLPCLLDLLQPLPLTISIVTKSLVTIFLVTTAD